jgi:hypothetical protein
MLEIRRNDNDESAGYRCERRPQAGGPPQGAGARQAATEASGDRPHARPLQKAEADPLQLSARAVPLRRMIKTMGAASMTSDQEFLSPSALRLQRRQPVGCPAPP